MKNEEQKMKIQQEFKLRIQYEIDFFCSKRNGDEKFRENLRRLDFAFLLFVFINYDFSSITTKIVSKAV